MAFKDCSLAKIVSSSAFFATLNEHTYISILVDVLKAAFSMRQVLVKLSIIDTAIAEDQLSFSMSFAVLPVTNICFSAVFVLMVSASMSLPLHPLSLIDFFLAVVQS